MMWSWSTGRTGGERVSGSSSSAGSAAPGRPCWPTLLRRWERTYDLDLVCVICSADADERERRIRTRQRHAAHAEADQRQLLELDRTVDYSRLPGAHIAVTTEQHATVTVRSVLRRLDAPARLNG